MATDAGLLLLVPSENLDSTDHVMPGACFAGQPAVCVEPAWIRSDYRSKQAERQHCDRAPVAVVEIGHEPASRVVSAMLPDSEYAQAPSFAPMRLRPLPQSSDRGQRRETRAVGLSPLVLGGSETDEERNVSCLGKGRCLPGSHRSGGRQAPSGLGFAVPRMSSSIAVASAASPGVGALLLLEPKRLRGVMRGPAWAIMLGPTHIGCLERSPRFGFRPYVQLPGTRGADRSVVHPRSRRTSRAVARPVVRAWPRRSARRRSQFASDPDRRTAGRSSRRQARATQHVCPIRARPTSTRALG